MDNIYRKYKDNDSVFSSLIKSDEVFNHRDRMTLEGLHSKSDIAMELGYRDILLKGKDAEIAELEAKVQELEAEIHSLKHEPMTVANYNKIKDEGIREMVGAFNTQVRHIHCDKFALEYADNLTKEK